MDNYLTVYEISDKLHVSIRTIYKLLRAKKILAKKVGRVWRVSEKSMENYLNGQYISKCPQCSGELLFQDEHEPVGWVCPKCKKFFDEYGKEIK